VLVHAPRRITVRAVLLVAALAMVLVAGAVGIVYRDQLGRYVTHLKGSPTETEAWRPFPADDPLQLHLANQDRRVADEAVIAP
jgi:hypothetical protein